MTIEIGHYACVLRSRRRLVVTLGVIALTACASGASSKPVSGTARPKSDTSKSRYQLAPPPTCAEYLDAVTQIVRSNASAADKNRAGLDSVRTNCHSAAEWEAGANKAGLPAGGATAFQMLAVLCHEVDRGRSTPVCKDPALTDALNRLG